MFSYPGDFDQHRPSELEAIADDLEYRASRARRAARLEARDFLYRPRQQVHEDQMPPHYFLAGPRTGPFQSARRGLSYYEPEPRRYRYRDVTAFPDDISERYLYAPGPARVQHRHPSDFNFSHHGVSTEQGAREERESRLRDAAERARVRAEARRLQALKQREEQERARMEEHSPAREVEEAVQAVARLIFGSQLNDTARDPPVPHPTVAGRATPSRSVGDFEDFFDQVVGLGPGGSLPRAYANQRAHDYSLPPITARVQFSPINASIPQAPASKGVEKRSNMASKDSSSASPVQQPSPKHSPSLPIPGRTFRHLPQNPRDPGLSAEEMRSRSGAADEVADIVEAIKRSLDPSYNAEPSDVEVVIALAAGNDSPSSSNSSPKSTTIHQQFDSANLPKPQSSTMATVRSIEARFVGLTHKFVFPSSPDFTAEPSQESSPSTPKNQPIRAHEHELTGLLTELDAVESDGDEDIRRARKGLVSRIQTELAGLERRKDKANQRRPERESDDGVEGYTIKTSALPAQEEENTANSIVLLARAPSCDSPQTIHDQPPSPTVEPSQSAPADTPIISPVNSANAPSPHDATASSLESAAEPSPALSSVSAD